MTIGEFCEAVAKFGRAHGGSVTSWGRTLKRSVAVGGFAGDPHTNWVGCDLVYDTGANRPDSEGHPRSPKSCPACSGLGLKVIHEQSHDHVQPFDLPAGPVARYP